MVVDSVLEAFTKRFAARAPLVGFAPGRVNLIGEHTDYNEGFVFPAAIQRGVAVAARPTGGPSKLISIQEGEAEPIAVRDAVPGSVSGWAAYAAGVAWAMREAGFTDLPDLEAVVSGDLPRASGLSSSAAIELAFVQVWNSLGGYGLTQLEMALIAQRAENDFVGVKCGLMDQMASACGREGHAMFIDMRTKDVRYARIPERWSLVVCDTQSPRRLTDSAYNERLAECRAAAEALGVSMLRDASLEQLFESEGELDPIVVKRARHVITENTRCQSLFWALEDENPLRVGLLMQASHESLREDYEVTSRELDVMAESCWSAPGCVGARMTGAGFGGCCIALVESTHLEEFKRWVANGYEARTDFHARFFVCRPSNGATVLPGK